MTRSMPWVPVPTRGYSSSATDSVGHRVVEEYKGSAYLDLTIIVRWEGRPGGELTSIGGGTE